MTERQKNTHYTFTADFFDSGHLEDQEGRNHTHFCHKMAKNLQFVPDLHTFHHKIFTNVCQIQTEYSRHSSTLQVVETQDIQGVRAKGAPVLPGHLYRNSFTCPT